MPAARPRRRSTSGSSGPPRHRDPHRGPHRGPHLGPGPIGSRTCLWRPSRFGDRRGSWAPERVRRTFPMWGKGPMMRTARLAVAVTIALLAAACSGGAAPTEETGVLGVSIERPAASEPAAAVTRTPTPTPTATTTPSETSSPTETAPPPPPPPAPEPEPEPPPPPPEPEPEPDPEPTPVAPFTVYSSSLSYSDGFVTEASSTTTDRSRRPPRRCTMRCATTGRSCSPAPGRSPRPRATPPRER